MSEQIPLIGMSDPITFPTGFARVMRELFDRLAQDPRYRLAYISRGWVGTSRWPEIRTYVGSDEFCQDQFPVAAVDFTGFNDPYVLMTLQDPWQVGWIVNPGNNVLSTPNSAAFWRDHRKRTRWVGHFPVDGWGPGSSPPLWVDQFLNGPDETVFMSDFGRRVMEPHMKTKWRTILHAVDTSTYRPLDKDQAKERVEQIYLDGLVRTLRVVMAKDGEGPTVEQVAEEAERKRLRLEGKFVILCVMANRERKLWPQVLEAFKGLLDKGVDAKLIAICGDRNAEKGGDWPIMDYARMLGLNRADDPVVWAFDSLGKSPWEEDEALALFNSAADDAVLLSTGEGFGLPQLEAHACGTPCTVGRYSASEDQIVDSREAVEPRSFTYAGSNMVRRPGYRVSDVVDRLVFAARNPGWRQEVGLKAAEVVRERHSWDIILPQWKQLFEEVWAGDGEQVQG